MNYTEEFENAYDELQKAIRNRSHLVMKVVTDKNGHQRHVLVNPNKDLKKNKTVAKKEPEDERIQAAIDTKTMLEDYENKIKETLKRNPSNFEELKDYYISLLNRYERDIRSMPGEMKYRLPEATPIHDPLDIMSFTQLFDLKTKLDKEFNTKKEKIENEPKKLAELNNAIKKDKGDGNILDKKHRAENNAKTQEKSDKGN